MTVRSDGLTRIVNLQWEHYTHMSQQKYDCSRTWKIE
jgi:hypothetical protein